MKSTCKIDKDGTKRWYNEQGQLHREDGSAVEHYKGSREWHINGKPHREDGPALEGLHGDKYWFYHGEQIEVSSQEEFERFLKLKMFW